MSTRQDVDVFLDFLRSTFVEIADKENGALSATSTLRSMPSNATISLEDTITEVRKHGQREKPRSRHISLLSRLRRPPKTTTRTSFLPTKDLAIRALPTIR
jgi:hypothetical protein